MLAQTVVDEVQFYQTDTGSEYVDWDHWKSKCSMRVESLPAADIQAYCAKFGPGYYEKLDPGEAEALALLAQDDESKICSADKIVWRVLGNTNATERGISLEEILTKSGLTKSLPLHFTKAFREEWCRKGFQERLMGRGGHTDRDGGSGQPSW